MKAVQHIAELFWSWLSNVCYRGVASRSYGVRLLSIGAAVGFLMLAPTSAAAVAQAWLYRFSNVVSNSNDEAFLIARDASGDIIVSGVTDEITPHPGVLTIKYSGVTGRELWESRYASATGGYADRPRVLGVDGSGDVLLAGQTQTFGGRNWVIKYGGRTGVKLWEKNYPVVENEISGPSFLDAEGNVFISGFFLTPTTNGLECYLRKYSSSDGTLVWEKSICGGVRVADGKGDVVIVTRAEGTASNLMYVAADGAVVWEISLTRPPPAVKMDSSGNVLLFGDSATGFYTAKYAAADGTLLWERRYNGLTILREVGGGGFLFDADGNLIVRGVLGEVPDGDGGFNGGEFLTAKYAGVDGALLWERLGPGAADDFPDAMALDGEGNVIVAEYFQNESLNADYHTAKYSGIDGRLIWEQRYDGPAHLEDHANALVLDQAGNVVVTGSSRSEGGNYDYYTVKYAAGTGAKQWEQRYNGRSKNEDYPSGVAVDASGSVIVTGSSLSVSGNRDYYTAKYGVNGALIWEQRYDGPANGFDRATGLALDGKGNVAVTGFSMNSNRNWDYYTTKYDGASGVPLWERRYNGPANWDDQARAVAVDASGNVVVTGASYNSSQTADYYTAKYDGTNGALIWERRYNGTGNGDDQPSAIAVDASGNVVVTGYSGNANGNADYYTAKYGAGGGEILWEHRYNGPANGDDKAYAVVVDGNGNAVVTGARYAPNGSDYYTAKYAARDGTLLWEKSYNGPANNFDIAKAVTVDREGNVIVTGVSVAGGSAEGNGGDFYTVKYRAEDGGVMWARRYDGPAKSYDSGNAVAVDESGNVVVTGSVYVFLLPPPEAGVGPEFYTAKYASADGALIWESRYGVPGRGEDLFAPYSLALGPNGMVAITGGFSGDYLTIVYREGLSPLSIVPLPAGVSLRFTGTAGHKYTIERAFSVGGPWEAVNVGTASSEGVVDYEEINVSSTAAFYRTSTTEGN